MKVNRKFLEIEGFVGTSISSGIKKNALDLSVIKSTVPSIGAGVYTTNKTVAAPVVITKEALKNEHLNALIINSGNANACTGEQGYKNAQKMIDIASELLALDKESIAVSSTGVIGVQLPMENVSTGIKSCCEQLSSDQLHLVPTGIMTTDTFEKVASVQFMLDDQLITMTGMAKGSGMIHPNMATMLGFVLTDVDIEKHLLQQAISAVTKDTFNMVSVDGDTSTNDMVLVMANGVANNKRISSEDDDYFVVKHALYSICESLSIQIAEDGEGATKLLTVEVCNAHSKEQARILAKSVVASSLVKAAFFGSDANWGRIVCALGYSGAEFNPQKVNLSFESTGGNIDLMRNGMGLAFDEAVALNVLSPNSVKILINLNHGTENATAWGCDLSYEYVKINGEYRT